jgi:hypothetical protein
MNNEWIIELLSDYQILNNDHYPWSELMRYFKLFYGWRNRKYWKIIAKILLYIYIIKF